MRVARSWEFSAELFTFGVLGPFPQGRVVRGIHFFANAITGDPFVRLACSPWESPQAPASEAEMQAITRSFFRGTATGVVPDPYLVLPTEVDCYLPLQAVFNRATYIAYEVLTMDALGSYAGSICTACGLGSVRSSKRRGRTVQVIR